MSATSIVTVAAAGACSLLLVVGCEDRDLVCAAAGTPVSGACSYVPPAVLHGDGRTTLEPVHMTLIQGYRDWVNNVRA